MAAEQRFQDRVVIVTGGTSGIGEGIVRLFAKHGGKVVFSSNQVKEGVSIQDELNKVGPGEVTFVNYSAESEEDNKKVVETAVSKYGRIDCLVNNVGMHPPHKPIDCFSGEEFRKLLDINVFSCFFASKYALPHIRKTKGSVINVASLVARLGQREAVTYCASKGAIVGMTKAMAVDEASYGVRVNCISPGNILTPSWTAALQSVPDPQRVVQTGSREQVLGRFGTPDDCAQTVLFLATVATFITGVDLPVSGGAELDYGIKFGDKLVSPQPPKDRNP